MELRGSLGDFDLTNVIQLLESGRKTGALRVVSPGAEAVFYFAQGQLVHATYSGQVGEEAVCLFFRSLFLGPKGEFWFKTESLPRIRTITRDCKHLVLEAARVFDESRGEQESEWNPWILESAR